ncbi:MAG TPA: hypothetical protein VFL64_09220 [Rhizobacter sp.]|nr:hypothetical protein [Rhizobacter sp.]
MTSAHIKNILALLAALVAVPAWSQDKQVYRCPGNPVLYTDTLSAKEAKDKGCRTLEGAPITVIQSPKPRTGTPVPSASRGEGSKVDANEQRARDTDSRRILENELKKEEDQLAALQKEYNNGEPDRQGDEKNYQKYLDRVAEMKAAIARKENDVAALRRELGKLPQQSQQPQSGLKQLQ